MPNAERLMVAVMSAPQVVRIRKGLRVQAKRLMRSSTGRVTPRSVSSPCALAGTPWSNTIRSERNDSLGWRATSKKSSPRSAESRSGVPVLMEVASISIATDPVPASRSSAMLPVVRSNLPRCVEMPRCEISKPGCVCAGSIRYVSSAAQADAEPAQRRAAQTRFTEGAALLALVEIIVRGVRNARVLPGLRCIASADGLDSALRRHSLDANDARELSAAWRRRAGKQQPRNVARAAVLARTCRPFHAALVDGRFPDGPGGVASDDRAVLAQRRLRPHECPLIALGIVGSRLARIDLHSIGLEHEFGLLARGRAQPVRDCLGLGHRRMGAGNGGREGQEWNGATIHGGSPELLTVAGYPDFRQGQPSERARGPASPATSSPPR